MTDFNFKEGDKVYYPMATNEILKVTPTFRVYYLSTEAETDDDMLNTILTPKGKLFRFHHNPAFFPATQEWYDKLVHVYPDLERPPVKKSSKEIIQAMLDDGWTYIPCRVDDYKGRYDYVGLVNLVDDTKSYPFIGNSEWKYATPFDPRTGKGIIDYVDGEVVLED